MTDVTSDTDSGSDQTDDAVINVELETAVRPTIRIATPVDDDESLEAARKRAINDARHEAGVLLSETIHEYDWNVVDLEVAAGSIRSDE